MKKWSPPQTAQRQSRETASAILWALHMGGPVESAGGQATKMLERRMRALKLWKQSSSKNFLYIATRLATPEWGNAIKREAKDNGRCVRIALRIDPDSLPTPPAGWSAKDAILQAETIAATEVDKPARERSRDNAEGNWIWPAGVRETSREIVRAILWTLHDLGGTVRSQEGYAPSVLTNAVEERTGLEATDTMRYLLVRLYDETAVDYYGRPVLARQGTDRHTHQLKLMVSEEDMPRRPEAMPQPAKVETPEPEVAPVATNGTTPQPALPVPQSESSPLDPIDLVMAAQRLLTEAVLQIASQPTVSPAVADHDVVLRRLNDALEENQRLRRRVSEAELAREGKVKEVDAVKRLLAETQANLDALRGPAANKAKEIEKMMRERPKVR